MKVTVNIPDDVMTLCAYLAQVGGTTRTVVIQQSILNQHALHQEVERGSKILSERPDGSFRLWELLGMRRPV
jgi:hypothetical protein